MKNLFKICLLSFVLLSPQNAFSKNYDFAPAKEIFIENHQNHCYLKSNINYNYCMMNCVSITSPNYIVRMCSSECVAKINSEFFNCILQR